jgi:hypothetical protein
MNSTEDAPMGQVIGALFDEVLLPIALRLRAEGRQPFPLAPDVSRLSYYVRRQRAAMSREDFSGASCMDAAHFGQLLAAHWTARGRHELAAQAGRFAAAAAAAQAQPASTEAAQGELSPYVYAMF